MAFKNYPLYAEGNMKYEKDIMWYESIGDAHLQ